MKSLAPELKKIFDNLSLISGKAYHDVFLISNQVLCKNQFSSRILERFFTKTILTYTPAHIVKKLGLYYLKSLFYYSIFIVRYCISRFIFSCDKTLKKSGKELVVIDTYFLVQNICKNGKFQEHDLPGLDSVLVSRNVKYVYMPFFYGAKGVVQFFKACQILEKQSVPILTEFQLLSFVDLLSLLFFVLLYPYHLLRFVIRYESSTNEEKQLISEVKDSLDDVVLAGYARYLQGKRLGALPFEIIKCISWYENQIGDKNLYKGLRDSAGRVEIIGTQLFIKLPEEMHVYADEREGAHGVVPDKILVNGPYYIPDETQFNYSVGPSLRYKHIFSPKKRNDKFEDCILILLPYYDRDIRFILEILKEIDSVNEHNIMVKFHPATDSEEYSELLPSYCQEVTTDLHDIISSARVAVGAASGVLLEVAASGTPVIVIKCRELYDLNYLPPSGRGAFWDEATDSEEFQRMLKDFVPAVEENKEQLESWARELREMFFCEPIEEKIVEAFGL